MIFSAFKRQYQEPTPTAIYPHRDGYLVVAPNTEDLKDYNDPFYVISDDLKTVTKIGAKDLMYTLKVLQKRPLWTKDGVK